MDNYEEQNLLHFFREMKAKDSAKPVPQFPKLRKSKSWSWVPIGIAASLALLIWFFKGNETNTSLDKDLIIITLEEGKNNELQFRIETTTELESWESSTSSLLKEF
jgi:hypothetical protein